MDIEVRVLGGADEAVLANVAAGVFDNPVDPALAREFLGDPRHHIAVAVDAGVVVGFASGVDYVHPDKPRELWINEVAVAPTHRRRGVGTSVLKALLGAGRTRGCAVGWVLTYASNPAAEALYASLGGTPGADTGGLPEALRGYAFALGPAGPG